MSQEINPTCSQQIMFISSAGSSCGCYTEQQQQQKEIHSLKARISLAAVASWHAVYGKASEKLLTTSPWLHADIKSSRPAVVGIKVHASYLRHRAFCSLRIFMAVLYAENLTLLRSATDRDNDRGGMKGRQAGGSEKSVEHETGLMRGLLCSSLSLKNRGKVANCSRRHLLSGSWLAGELDVICQASGRQQILPKFHRLLFVWLLIKSTVTPGNPTAEQICILDANADRENARGRSRTIFLLHANCTKKYRKRAKKNKGFC